MSKSDMTTTTDLTLRASIAQVPITLRGTLEGGKFGELSGLAKIDKSLISLLNDLGADFGEENKQFKDLLGEKVPDIKLESLAFGYRNIKPKFAQVVATITAGKSSCQFHLLKMLGNGGFIVGLNLQLDKALFKSNPLSGLIGDISIGDLGIFYAKEAFKNVKYLPGDAFQDAKILKPDIREIKGRDFTKGLNYFAKILVGDVKLIDVPRLMDETDAGSDKQEAPQRVETGEEPEAKQLTKGSTLWIKTDKSLGPLSFKRVGLHYDAPRVGIKLDAALRLSALTLSFEGLGLSYPINQFTKDPQKIWENLKFHLDGAAVSFEEGPLAISGGLLKVSDDPLQLDGSLLIRTEMFTMSALGSYADVNGTPSFFAFAFLDKDLGGPSFFHVTGLAAGFGVNRSLKLPPIEEVHTFPLVQMAMGNGTPKVKEEGAGWALAKMQDHIMPADGAYWFAVGVRFSTFEMIQSFALLSVSFGREVVIGLLGISKMTVPKGASTDSAVAYAELAIRAVIKPEEGTIEVEGRLTDNSYIFSKDCRLTGGFAFYTWFSGPHGGDFVVTLGGYHPRFKPPAHYPAVPRLGIHWQVSSHLRVIGELYFALTPSCLMAGGKLSAVYESGCIRAWFVAYADFLLNWKPFYYMIDMGITPGVACRISINLGFVRFTLSIRVELGVELHLWGPPFAGKAHVHLYVISFTIPFGPAREPPNPLTANEFIQSFLPPGQENSAEPDVITVLINNGLIRQKEGKNNEILRVVNAHELTLTARSLIPSTCFDGLAKGAKSTDAGKEKKAFGIRPMGKTTLDSTLRVTMMKSDVEKTPKNLSAYVVETGVPEAIWGKSDAPGRVSLPSSPEAKTMRAEVGVRISFTPLKPEHALSPIPLEKLKYEQLRTKVVKWEDLGEVPTIGAPEGATIWNTIWDNEGVDAKRNAILGILNRQSPFVMNEPELEQFRRSERDYFQSDPEFCALGESLK